MKKRWAAWLAAAAIVIGFAIANRHALLRFAIAQGASLASGYTVRLSDQRIGLDATTLYGVAVSHRGQPLLDADRLDVRYSLRDLLPGSTHRFGLTAITINAAKLTIVKFSDGSYNFVIPSGQPAGPSAPQAVDNVPLRFALQMHGAALELREPKAYDPSAAHVRVRDFNVDASIDSAMQTRYRARGVFVQRTD
ncbi:MAG: hypothetical protein JO092_01255, partial [Candidatus Eremiobacteraeota bacterium]|nr:hypothetical protein [Candidatus Eremiobacteraeota bacterium]